MDPVYEQRLRDEVIYLHSLWHHGHSRSLTIVNLQPLNSTKFKKLKTKNPKFKARKPKKVGNFSGTEWPVKPVPADPPVNQSGWPELKLKPNPQTTRLPTPEELEKYKWNRVQQMALKAAKEFYSRNGEESDEDDDADADDDDMDEDSDDAEDKEYDFFWKLFNGDEELKAYYLKHCAGGGEFSCLVCGGANEKHRKRFKDCIALVQHSISIAKTKKIRSHRAYGKVICKVLDWDIDRLPSSIVSDHKPGELHGLDANVDKDASIAACNSDLNGKTQEVSETADGESMVCENSTVVANVEGVSNKNLVLNEAEGNTGGAAVNNLEHVINNGAGTSTGNKLGDIK